MLVFKVRLYFLFFSLLLLWPYSSWSQEESYNNKTGEYHSEVQGEKTPRAVSYAGQRDIFQRFCKNIIADGQHDIWNQAVEKARVANDKCKYCRSLYKGLTCKSKNSTERQAIDPSTELLVAISEFSRNMLEDPELAKQTAFAMDLVFDDLSRNSKSYAYFQTLIAYFKTAMENHLEANKQAASEQKKAIKQKELDKLF